MTYRKGEITTKVKDVTAPLRSRRYRRKKNGKGTKTNVTVRSTPAVTVTTIEMCSLAARVGDGRAAPGDLQLAERVIAKLLHAEPARPIFLTPCHCKHSLPDRIRVRASSDRNGIT
jgi:hypothetical protein